MAPESLQTLYVRAAIALYGEQWQADLSRDVGISERTLRRLAKGEAPIRQGMVEDLLILVRAKALQLRNIQIGLDRQLERMMLGQDENDIRGRPSTSDDDWDTTPNLTPVMRRNLAEAARRTEQENPGRTVETRPPLPITEKLQRRYDRTVDEAASAAVRAGRVVVREKGVGLGFTTAPTDTPKSASPVADTGPQLAEAVKDAYQRHMESQRLAAEAIRAEQSKKIAPGTGAPGKGIVILSAKEAADANGQTGFRGEFIRRFLRNEIQDTKHRLMKVADPTKDFLTIHELSFLSEDERDKYILSVSYIQGLLPEEDEIKLFGVHPIVAFSISLTANSLPDRTFYMIWQNPTSSELEEVTRQVNQFGLEDRFDFERGQRMPWSSGGRYIQMFG